MIQVYTKKRHISKIKEYLNYLNLEHRIYTIEDDPPLEPFDLGVSYCYPRKILEPLLSTPKNGFVNYHPAPLPKYKGPNELIDGINNKVTQWGVTVHYMDENYDTGPIIKVKKFELDEPPTSIEKFGEISHFHLFSLFKETIKELLLNHSKFCRK